MVRIAWRKSCGIPLSESGVHFLASAVVCVRGLCEGVDLHVVEEAVESVFVVVGEHVSINLRWPAHAFTQMVGTFWRAKEGARVKAGAPCLSTKVSAEQQSAQTF